MTQSSYTYQLVNGAGTAVGTSFTGTGGEVTRTVPGINASTPYRVKVITGTGISTSCQPCYQQQVSVTVTAAPVTGSAGTNRTVCGTSVTLQGSDPAPGMGLWTLSSTRTGNELIETPENPTTVVSNLTSGTYVFTWTITANCDGNITSESASVTITVNCPTSYSIQPPKYKSQYRNGDMLAIASDPDGGIGSAAVQGVLPAGTSLLSNGNIEVTNPFELQPGTYNLTVRTVDQKGVTTQTTLTLRIYGTVPTIVPLPVELLYFTAALQQRQVNLQWLTASETNNKEFVVERSTEGKAFESIGTVEGNGNSSAPIKYSFADTNPLAGTTYYRLKQVDFNGEFTYSRVVAVSARGIAAEMQLHVYPNPFNSEINIMITAQKNGSTLMQLIDMQGRVLHSGNLELHPGLNELTLPLRFVKNGMYILKLSGDDVNGTVKVLKQ